MHIKGTLVRNTQLIMSEMHLLAMPSHDITPITFCYHKTNAMNNLSVRRFLHSLQQLETSDATKTKSIGKIHFHKLFGESNQTEVKSLNHW